MLCHHRFITCNKGPILVGDVDSAYVLAGLYRKPLYFPPDFAVNLKLL